MFTSGKTDVWFISFLSHARETSEIRTEKVITNEVERSREIRVVLSDWLLLERGKFNSATTSQRHYVCLFRFTFVDFNNGMILLIQSKHSERTLS